MSSRDEQEALSVRLSEIARLRTLLKSTIINLQSVIENAELTLSLAREGYENCDSYDED